MMAPEVFEEARANAPMHVQLVQSQLARRFHHRAAGNIEGRIVRIFRDRDHVLHWGQRVWFRVPVIDASSRSSPTPSGTLYLDGERIGRSRWLEAFLESWQGEIHLVHSQLISIWHPTIRPVCGPDTKGFLCPGHL